MADQFKLKIITPTREFYTGDVLKVEFTTTEGRVGILPGHIPMTSIISPGSLVITESNDVKKVATLMAGFSQVTQTEVVILAETSEWPDEIDEKRAEAARDRAQKRISEKSGDIDTLRAEIALKRALVRIDVKNGL